MPHRDDPLKRRPRAKNREDIEDEIEKRLSGQLAHLMRDPRYLDGDPDYRAYIHRQFRRVYDDPSGKPKTLRIGRPKPFVDELEPFDPARERRLRLGHEKEGAPGDVKGRRTPVRQSTILTGGFDRGESRNPRTSNPSSLASANRRRNKMGHESESDVFLPETRALMELDPKTRTNRPLPSGNASQFALSVAGERVEQIQTDELRTELLGVLRSAQTFMDDLEIAKRHTSASLLRHYLLGSGTTVTLPAEFLSDWLPAQNAIGDVDKHFENWLMGLLNDSKVGMPTLQIQDGERIIIGGNDSGPTNDLRDRVNWDATFAGVGDAIFGGGNPSHTERDLFTAAETLQFTGEEMTSFGGATAQGFGFFILEREGDIVTIEGFVDYRIRDIYKFDWADFFNPGFRLLETHGIGKSFELVTALRRSDFNARIQLQNGRPSSIAIDRSPLKTL